MFPLFNCGQTVTILTNDRQGVFEKVPKLIQKYKGKRFIIKGIWLPLDNNYEHVRYDIGDLNGDIPISVPGSLFKEFYIDDNNPSIW